MMKKIVIILLVCLLSSLTANSSAASFINDYDAIENAAGSVIYLETDDDYDDDQIIVGSGFIAFDSQTFVTNYHVIEDAIRIIAFDEKYNEYKIDKILAVDKERDIAIISLKTRTFFKPLQLAYNPVLKRGQPVATIGYPKGLFNTFSTGIISAIVDFKDRREIQFTAPISHGSSGGALFNDNGEVIGITSSLIEDGQNINFAIDIKHVIELYSKINPSFTIKITKNTLAPQATPTTKPTSIVPSKTTSPTISQTRFKDNAVILGWAEIPGAIKYFIYRSKSYDGIYTLIGESLVTTYEDKTGVLGESYYYCISFMDENSTMSAKSRPISVKMPSPVPTLKATSTPKPSPSPPPSSIITNDEIAKYKTLKIGMNDPDVAKLKERMFELGYFANKTINNSFTTNTAEYVKEFQRINGLKVDGIATPEMQALFFSEYAIPKPQPTPTPMKPSGVKASLSGTTVTITWDAVKGVDKYIIYRSTSLNGTYTSLATIQTNKYVDKATKRGLTYYYKVVSVIGKNKSILSSHVKVSMPKPTPTPYIE
ncbi:MAG TPA: trypsin-like peptidase domain-containing protein, partial [Clostridia bacterium]|nr:trypsin-like peptidase domain-containing protein [Clostridia bacterium]